MFRKFRKNYDKLNCATIFWWNYLGIIRIIIKLIQLFINILTNILRIISSDLHAVIEYMIQTLIHSFKLIHIYGIMPISENKGRLGEFIMDFF